MKVLMTILIIGNFVLTIISAYQKDVVSTVMWAGLFLIQLIMYAVDLIKEHIDKTFKSE